MNLFSEARNKLKRYGKPAIWISSEDFEMEIIDTEDDSDVFEWYIDGSRWRCKEVESFEKHTSGPSFNYDTDINGTDMKWKLHTALSLIIEGINLPDNSTLRFAIGENWGNYLDSEGHIIEDIIDPIVVNWGEYLGNNRYRLIIKNPYSFVAHCSSRLNLRIYLKEDLYCYTDIWLGYEKDWIDLSSDIPVYREIQYDAI